MMSRDTNSTPPEVVLGFLEEAKHWRLLPPQFPSKVGGRPAWLSQRNLPSPHELECEVCRLPMAFLLQVYAPIFGLERSFHRTVFVFCCKTDKCYTCNNNSCIKVFRSQLPRRNEFYPFNPPPEEEPTDNSEADHSMLLSGLKLCWVCGCLGNKACSRCHMVTYCGKHHQTVHWKHTHKKECSSPETTTVKTSPFLFREYELVTEPEEEEVDEAEIDTTVVEEERSALHSSIVGSLTEADLEEVAMHETEDNKVFQQFKKKIASEPHQVLRYSRGGSPLWVSSQHIPSDNDIPLCTCGAPRCFEFQVMPQLLNSLSVDSMGMSIDWGTLAVYTCSVSCNQGDRYISEFIWKQDFISEHIHSENPHV
ncbi:programmed cell death protein 2 isoform X1 [Takifugu rubripes]|uniref:Programmed cell death 2 n=1 Tax=Takifugu rubripes TaxID=31033 RepID=A0A3B5KE08_TAKRU|nr:programmed cell death protein 2 isoform X1 [Takifugu rubripes]|eukprot:XP_003969537.1 PREDICTED: programmed cell death protein 2 isoform X1 [Takifugu rubripes]